MAGTSWMDGLAQDLKYGAKVMTQSPAFSLIALLTIGLALGASTAVFSVVNGVLIRPLPYAGQDRIMSLWRLAPVSNLFGVEDFPWGKADFSLYRQETKAFQSLGAFQPATFNLTGFGQPVFLEGIRATAGFFPTLSISPALGRYFTSEEEQKATSTLLTRSLGRSREFNIRVALGATSGRLIRQLMTESLVLALAGGLLGLALADAGIQLVKKFGPARLPRLQEISLDPAVFTFCLAVTLFTGVLFGLAPSFSATKRVSQPRCAQASESREAICLGSFEIVFWSVRSPFLLFSSSLRDCWYERSTVCSTRMAASKRSMCSPLRFLCLPQSTRIPIT